MSLRTQLLDDGYYSSPRWSWEILDCAMPMTFDTYSNCAFQCVYCFSFFQRAVAPGAKDAYLAHKVRPVDATRVKRMFTDPDRYAGQFAWYIKSRMVLQWGGLSDAFDWYERELRVSLDLLRFFREIDYPISISTKGVWYLEDPEYVEAFRGAANVQMKLSIITTDEQAARVLEAGVAPPAARFEALRKLKDLGVGVTTTRFRPYIIGVSDRTVEDVFRQSKAAGVDSLTTEFLCVEGRSVRTAAERWKRVSRVCGFDVFEFYKQHSQKAAGLMRLNYELKRPYVRQMEQLAAQYGIPFYVSDAHHKEASAGTGCCGLPETGPLSAINRGQYSEAIQIAKRTGRVRWRDIEPMAAPLKQVSWTGAEGYNVGGTAQYAKRLFSTMYDFMRDIWNTPTSHMSPNRYFGGALVAAGHDEDGNVVYVYNRPFVEQGVRVQSVNELLTLMEMKEAARADGGAAGHVAAPLVVPVPAGLSFERLAACRLLSEARLPFQLIVDAGCAVDVQDLWPDADVRMMPGGGASWPAMLAWIAEQARREGWVAYWLLDPELEGFAQRGPTGAAVPASTRAALSFVEGVVSAYDNVALAGFDVGPPAAAGEVGWRSNRVPRAAIWVATEAPVPWATAQSEEQAAQACAAAGWATIVATRFAPRPRPAGGSRALLRPAALRPVRW